MSSYTFRQIKPLAEGNNNFEGFYLCVIHADKIPPHIGLSIDGKYFSLKAKGKDVGVPIIEVLKIVNKRSIKTLFIEIEVNFTLKEITTVFDNYDKAIVFETSCLSPIKELFIEGEKVQKLSDLLKSLESKGILRKIYGLNIDEDYEGIPHYEIDAIHQRLKTLLQIKTENHV